VRPIIFARNFGHQLQSQQLGFFRRRSSGHYMMATCRILLKWSWTGKEKWKEGYEWVYAVGPNVHGESWFKKFTASCSIRIIYRITDVKFPVDTGDFRLMDRQVVDVLNKMRERHRPAAGCRVGGFPANWRGWNTNALLRHGACTNIHLGKICDWLKCDYELFLFSLAGSNVILVFSSGGFAIFGYSIGDLFTVWQVSLNLPGRPLLWSQYFFLGGVQLICLGILGWIYRSLIWWAKGQTIIYKGHESKD